MVFSILLAATAMISISSSQSISQVHLGITSPTDCLNGISISFASSEGGSQTVTYKQTANNVNDAQLLNQLRKHIQSGRTSRHFYIL